MWPAVSSSCCRHFLPVMDCAFDPWAKTILSSLEFASRHSERDTSLMHSASRELGPPCVSPPRPAHSVTLSWNQCFICYSKDPKAFRNHAKPSLPVLAKRPSKACVTAHLFPNCRSLSILSPLLRKKKVHFKISPFDDNLPCYPRLLMDAYGKINVVFKPFWSLWIRE